MEDLSFDASGTLQFDAHIQFDAHFDHETSPWLGGDRLVLVVFSVGCIENLEPEPFNLLGSRCHVICVMQSPLNSQPLASQTWVCV